MNHKNNMYCKKCQEKIAMNGIKMPKQCEKCGEKIEIVADVGVAVYAVMTILLALIIIGLVKMVVNNEVILFIVLVLEVVIIPSLVEQFLYRRGILRYTNVEQK